MPKTTRRTRYARAIRHGANLAKSASKQGKVDVGKVMKAGGRLCVVTFHSLEDRIVKGFFAVRAGRTPGGSRHAPPVESKHAPSFQLMFNGVRAPSESEMAVNPRARSAKLRAAVRTEAPVWRQAA